MWKKYLMPKIHKEGYSFIIIFAVTTILLGMFVKPLFWIGLVLTLWCVYFFRNPDRIVPMGENLVVSPADGVVILIQEVEAPAELNMDPSIKFNRISIFLSVFNVHVNRVPASGIITKLIYFPGKFLNASLDKASIHNERQTVLMKTKLDQDLIFTQIAGLVARRIVCDLEENQEVTSGERFGIIRFGSRCDVYLPIDIQPKVLIGQTIIGGETILADLNGGYEAAIGETK